MPQRTASVRTFSFRSMLLLLVLSLSAVLADAQNLTFTPGLASAYAGDTTGKLGVSGPNYTGPASGLVLGPQDHNSIIFDSAGNLYILDQGNAILRVVAASSASIPVLPGVTVQPGHVYTVAGTTNTAGSSVPCSGGSDTQGNGCPATVAAINGQDQAIGVDGNGNVYVAEFEQVRVIYGGKGTLPGIANPQPGYIYALTNAANSNSQSDNGMGGPAVAATTPNIGAMAVDSYGNVYIFDNQTYNLMLVYMGGTLPPSFFNGATPTPGNIYLVTNGYGSCPASNQFCDGEPFVQTYYDSIDSMSTDASGNLYIVDNGGDEIRGVSINGQLPGVSNPVAGNIYAVAGNQTNGTAVSGGQATASPLEFPFQFGAAIASDNVGNLYFSNGNFGQQSVYKVDASGNMTTAFGGTALCAAPTDSFNDGCAATAVSNLTIGGIAIDSKGNLYALDGNYPTPNVIFQSSASASALDYSGTVGVSSASQTIYVSNTGIQALQLSNIAFSGPFLQVATGSNDCSNSTSLATGASCQIAVSFLGTQAGGASGALTVSSNALDATDNSNVVTLAGTAAKASSSTSVVVSPGYLAVANVGQPVTFTASVTAPPPLTIVPSGSVTFMNGSTQLGTANITNGVAIFTTSSLAAGKYAVTAVYSGDGTFLTSTSSAVNLTVSATPAAIVTLSTSATTENSGQSITLTATAASFSGSGVPTGTITFQDAGNPLPNGTVQLNGGTATLTTTALPPGNNELIAVYSGDSNFVANASSDVIVTVTAAGQLQFTPGIISLLGGSYFTSGSGGNGVAATSIALGTMQGPGVVDSYGNVYISSNNLFVVASGNGPIPGIANPVKGNIYILGTGSACSGSSPCGDSGPANQAFFEALGAIAIDALNNIYLSDNGVIRKISAATGVINTVAGTWGGSGFSGDGGPATSAKIRVTGLFADQNSNLYFADNGDLLVRRIDGQTGVITTVAGTTAGAGPIPGATPLNACNALPCGDGGLAISAHLLGPVGVFVDSTDDIYIAENGEYVPAGANAEAVRKIDGKTGVISLIAGQYAQSCFAVAPCGDGGPASGALFNGISSIVGDNGGDLYIADNTLAVVREINVQTGIINTVVGTATGEGGNSSNQSNLCTTAPCGDDGSATSALLKSPAAALDSQGNMYVFDNGTHVIREVSVTTTALAYGSQNLGTTTPQTVSVANIGLQPLTFSGLTIPTPNYEQQTSGGADCTADTSLSSGASCQFDIAFFPTATGPLPATAAIASNSTNATNGQNTITLTGTGTGLGGATAQTITFQPIPGGVSYGSKSILLTASSDSGQPVTFEATGPATVSGSSLIITGAGTVKVTAYQFGNSQYAAANPVSQSISVAPATLTVAATNQSLIVGTPLTAPTFMITGFVNSDTQATTTTGAPALTVVDSSGNTVPVGSTPLSGTYTIKIQQGTLLLTGGAAANYTLVFTNGTLNITGSTVQTLSFPPIANVTYGASTITLAASSTSNLQITYTVKGPASVFGNLLTVTGAGAVAVTANQSGNSQYAAAIPLTVSFNVNKAPLNVAANSVTVAQGSPIPPLTYTIAGFVNGDTQAVVTGSPTLTTSATSTSPIGQYPITVAVGTLAAANYSFNLVPGNNVSIVTPVAQTINFASIPGVTYGTAPITLGATSSSGLGVSYTVAGPAILSSNVLTIRGAGVVTVTATQVGNSTYGPATPVTQSFSVSPAVLTVTANNATRMNDTQNPTFTYTISNLVNGDTANIAVSGTPALTTTATVSSPVGTYPITPAAGNLASANYTFNFVPGTLTITSGGPAQDFSLAVSPQSLMVSSGQIVQATITLSPLNFYQGLVKLSCGSLPANVTCTFSPATLSPNGGPVTGTLTVNTNTGSPVVGQIQPMKSSQVMSASFFYLPAGLFGLLIAFRRRQIAKYLKPYQWLVLLVMLAGAAGLTACGAGSSASSSSTVAAPGSSVITLTATDSAGGPTHTINIGLKVE